MVDFWAMVSMRVLGNLIPLLAGLVAAFVIQKRKGVTPLPKWPIIIGAVLSVPAVVLTMSKALAKSTLAPVEVMTAKQSANGLAPNELSYPYVEQIGKFLAAEMKRQVPDAPAISPQPSIIEKDGAKLGVLRMERSGVTPIVSVLGIRGSELIRVTCAVPDNRTVDYRDPACATALKKNFGTVLD